MKTSTKVMIALQALLMLYSTSNVFSKLAAGEEFGSVQFFLFYGAVLLVLAIYALGWQQIIKRMPLTTAYANKAITIVWGIVFGAAFFGEGVTPLMLVGATVIMAGIILYAVEEGRLAKEQPQPCEPPRSPDDGEEHE